MGNPQKRLIGSMRRRERRSQKQADQKATRLVGRRVKGTGWRRGKVLLLLQGKGRLMAGRKKVAAAAVVGRKKVAAAAAAAGRRAREWE